MKLKTAFLALLSLALSAIICQYKGDAWEEKIRSAYYSTTKDSVPVYIKTIVDENGVPYVYYAMYNNITAGKQYNPTIVSNYAIDYYNELTKKDDSAVKKKFLNCIDWLAKNINYKDGYALYTFNWQHPYYDSIGSNWTSGMTSGRAIEAFSDAYLLSSSQKYIDYSMSLLRGYYQPIQSGGFTYKGPDGWWYEEYASINLHTPKVMNGHVFALQGVQKLWSITKNDSAAFIVQQGVLALKNKLADYSMPNGWSYYDAYHKVADEKYHTIHTKMMKELFETTKEPVFNEYYKKWNASLTQPYIYRIVSKKNRSGLILYGLISAVIFALFLLLLTFIKKRKR
ncbi:MAG: hypothetical protein IPP48_09850 [Chitinophagaceae bacterium]|nr:hypothetical protein [Chitinophagaceae bacterium]